MDKSILFGQMVQLFLIILCGFSLFKIKILTKEVDRHLTRLLLEVTLPLMILGSVMSESKQGDSKRVLEVILISVVIYLLLPAFSWLLVKILHFPKQQQGLYMFMHTYSNVGFMGFPVLNALYGQRAVVFAAILNVIFNLSAYSIGIMMMHYGTEEKKKFSLRFLLNPGIIGSVVAIAFYFIPVTFPGPLVGAISSVGGLTSPLAMLLIGANLADIPVKKLFDDWRVFVFTILKQAIVPVLLWPLMKFCIEDSYVRNVIFVLLLMPIANSAVLFATQYQKDEALAAKGVFFSTLISIITIPLAITLCHV